MSEWEAFVCCTCYQDGRTTKPPRPREELMINRHGIVTLERSTSPGDDPDDLYDWRIGDPDDPVEPACSHYLMHLVEEIFYRPGNFPNSVDFPAVERLLGDDKYPALYAAMHSPTQYEFPSGGTWLTADQAAEALAELRTLHTQLSGDLEVSDARFLRILGRLLTASTQTGNPIVSHYNGIGDDSGW